MRTPRLAAISLVSLFTVAGALVACGESDGTPKAKPVDPQPTAPAKPLPAGHIIVDHILIGVRSGSLPKAKRDADEAGVFARNLFAKLKAGEDWAAAKLANSEDGQPGSPGGPYTMSDLGVPPAVLTPEVIPRDQMAPAFGDVGFKLAVGEMGLANYDAVRSPFGFHIIKRIK